MTAKKYIVIKAHKGFAKGDFRVMHPNLASMLADRGLVDIDSEEQVSKGSKRAAKVIEPVKPKAVKVTKAKKVPAKKAEPKPTDNK